jgi:hypothetical protein
MFSHVIDCRLTIEEYEKYQGVPYFSSVGNIEGFAIVRREVMSND